MYYYEAARQERSEEKERGKKKHLEFKIQITVSITETGTRENILKRHWIIEIPEALYSSAFSKENSKRLTVGP